MAYAVLVESAVFERLAAFGPARHLDLSDNPDLRLALLELESLDDKTLRRTWSRE